MKDSRYWGGYASTEHGLLVTGGYRDPSMCLKNKAEYLSKPNGTWEYLPDVPFYSYGSCLVELNRNVFTCSILASIMTILVSIVIIPMSIEPILEKCVHQ